MWISPEGLKLVLIIGAQLSVDLGAHAHGTDLLYGAHKLLWEHIVPPILYKKDHGILNYWGIPYKRKPGLTGEPYGGTKRAHKSI